MQRFRSPLGSLAIALAVVPCIATGCAPRHVEPITLAQLPRLGRDGAPAAHDAAPPGTEVRGSPTPRRGRQFTRPDGSSFTTSDQVDVLVTTKDGRWLFHHPVHAELLTGGYLEIRDGNGKQRFAVQRIQSIHVRWPTRERVRTRVWRVVRPVLAAAAVGTAAYLTAVIVLLVLITRGGPITD